MRSQLPTDRPITQLLDSIESPADLLPLSFAQLEELATELRAYMLFSVGQTGGHLGAGLGVVELSIALLSVLRLPGDNLIWDVGHQSYPHKILTGRRDALLSLRQQHGIAPFPSRAESLYDSFGTGHSSTSISAALGMAIAAKLKGEDSKSVAVIGDGALTAGMAFEALNHAAHTGANLLIILNDNTMSISPNQGGLATYLASDLHNCDSSAQPLFESLNLRYRGPVDGHDLKGLLLALDECLSAEGPQFLHVRTQKGRGFEPAELDPVRYHAVAKIKPMAQASAEPVAAKTFSNCFGEWINNKGHSDNRILAITPAMREGSDLIAFSQAFPQRYFDVAIAEQHAATLAAGFACAGMKPILAIYSTFLQRAYDQIVHDIALQNLDLLIAIDRAGLVGEDGPTHSGLFDLSMLQPLPNMVILAPANADEQLLALEFGLNYPGPVAVRYPRGEAPKASGLQSGELELGKAHVLRSASKTGNRIAILNFGALLNAAEQVAETLNTTLVDMRFVKPLDETLVLELAKSHDLLVTIEDHAILGGVGSSLALLLDAHSMQVNLLTLGVGDQWVEHASRAEQLALAGLDAAGILNSIKSRIALS